MLKEECKKYLTDVVERLIEETPENDVEDLKDRFNKAQEIHKFENNYIYVIVKDALTKIVIEKFSSRRMNELLQEVSGTKLGFKFITEEEAKKENESNSNLISTPNKLTYELSNRKLRAEFTFDNFVIGESNRFAFITSMKVAESPYAILNPLYIFGDVGLGKTHLMMAIGHFILDKNINANVVYTSAQQFTEDFFLYTKKDSKNIEYFYNKYRQADILLVDDVQLLESKPATQEEFFKVFDYLHENNKQIVITSDRMASDLKIMERLKSRFSWGMPVDIQAPDRDLRINILKRKLEYLLSTPNDVPIECLEAIADMFTHNIRELEGALRRFITYCVSMNTPFTVENVYSILESIAPKQNKDFKDQTDQKIMVVKKIVAPYFQISEEDLVSNSRKPLLVYARNLCYYIIRNKYNVSLKKIGENFGNKDHTTITHGYEKIKDMIKVDSKVKSDIQYLESKLES
ncbi:MAG: chromosomal replication initiator protein DnaA [Bacilli bacterium]|nr:chromosomal replication initiator protein DnaA [Acholeplasmataceae bacterium]MDY2903286.1 chromosomal replication initiator protein DnaA [Bacilli bacterium]